MAKPGSQKAKIRVDVQLQPGSISESVEVTAASPLLQTDRGITPATYQNGFPTAALPAIPANGILPAPTAQAYYTLNPNFKNPYVESWNVAVQQALPSKFVLTVSYVANHGVDEVSQYNLNAATVPA